MNRTTDQLLADIRDLSERIERTEAGTPAHDRLVAERAELRSAAMDRADAQRHPESVRTEIERIERRLEDFEAELIGAGYNEKHLGRTIQDPGAYRHTINRLLTEQSADEIAELQHRLGRLRALQGDTERAGIEPAPPRDDR